MTGNPLRMMRELVRYFATQPALQMQQLEPICAGADALVYGGLALFAAPSVCERLGLPGFGVLFTTCLLPSDQHPPPMIPWQGLPPWLNALLWRFDQPLLNLLVRGRLNQARATLGLPPASDVRAHLLGGTAPTLAVDALLLPPSRPWQDRFPYANFLFLDDPDPLDQALLAWLEEGEPPVFVGFGSMSGKGTDRIQRLIVAAVTATGRRCIVDAGWAGMGQAALPAGWRVVSQAPHALLFPRMAVVVHHGGSGTTAQALRAGVPQVVLPLMLDQFHHAHRLYLAGLAPQPMPMEQVSAAGLTQAIAAALALPEEPRMRASARLGASRAGAQIVQRIESLLPR
jgi:vancomycin aglycone glucosyltransferase